MTIFNLFRDKAARVWWNLGKRHIWVGLRNENEMDKMKKGAVIGAILACVLIASAFLPEWLNSSGPPSANNEKKFDVYVLTHINDRLSPDLIRSMLDQLKVVTGIQFCVWIDDNTTSGIMDAKARIAKWLDAFPDYNILIQCDYAFETKYGYYDSPFWKFNSIATLSQEFYNEWYSNLSEVLSQRPNVKLMVGFNEPYNHFETKEQAQETMKMEYLTWKNLSSIPFTVKFSMPYLYWADYWGFPKNPSIQNDLAPFWANYSDYVGCDLWADGFPPQYGASAGSFKRVQQTIETLENHSKLLGKPIFIGEYPAWDNATLKYISDHVAQAPNIGEIYQLWYWSGQEELHYDAWTYGLFNVDSATLQVTRGEPEWDVFRAVLNPFLP
jgi:hypothetical protein